MYSLNSGRISDGDRGASVWFGVASGSELASGSASSVASAGVPVGVAVGLGVDLIEGSGATKANTKVTIEPSSVTLAGDTSILGGVNRITLGTIDLTDFASTFTETYPITIDNELRNVTGVSEAKVTVEVVGLSTKSFRVSNLSYVGAAEGTTVDILTESLDVVIRGTEEQLAQIKAENIRAVADLNDIRDSTGSYMPYAKIYVDGVTDVGAIGDYAVSVEIRKANT